MISRISPLLKPRKQSGFGLLEMLLVLAIVGVFSAMAIPSYQNFMVQRDVNTTARDVAQMLEVARIRAQSRSSNVTFCPVTAAQVNAPNPTCSTQVADAWVVKEGELVIWRSALIPPTVLVCLSTSLTPNTCNVTASNPTRSFNTMGRPNALDNLTNGFTIRVAARNPTVQVQEAIVTLAATGRVTL